MPEWGTIGLFLVAALALVASPGPSVLYIVARSLNQGRGAGFASAAGIAVGALVHVLAAVVGLSALIASSATAFTVVKYLGAAYLIVLGLRELLTRPQHEDIAPQAPASLNRVFGQGILVEALNPKTALFFLAFLPQFVDTARGPATTQFLLLGCLLVLVGLLSDSVYALAAGAAGGLLNRSEVFARVKRYVSGGIYLGLGATTALLGARE